MVVYTMVTYLFANTFAEKLKEVFIDDSSIITIIVLVHLRFISYVLEHC